MNLMDNLIHMSNTQNFFTRKINIAIIGAGRAGSFHLQSLLQFSHFNLKYVLDSDLEKAQNLVKLYGESCIPTNNLSQVLDDVEIEAIIIASSTDTHHPFTIRCLEAGKHVLCEKPLSHARECFELSQNVNKSLMVAYHKRFDKNYQEIIRKLHSHKSKPKNIKMTLKDNFIPPLSYLASSGGIAKDMLTHDLDIINLIMDFQLPEKVVAFSHSSKNLKDIGEIENIEVLMQYSSGTLVTITSSRSAGYGYDHRMEVSGDFGLIKLENPPNNNVVEYLEDSVEHSPIQYNFPQRFKEAYLNELNYFYHMIQNKYPIIISPQSLEVNQEICELINQSLEHNKIITTLKPLTDNTLRVYEENTPQYNFYVSQHQLQTLNYVEQKLAQYQNLNQMKMTIHQALDMLDYFIDPSDPDVELPNSIHAYQTAERIRRKYPLQEELQLTGLIHDLGKVLFKFGEDSHSVVGDTYIVGCQFPKSIVFYETMKNNPDFKVEKYQTPLGIYEENCGLDKVKICFGHDEYLYLVLKNNSNHHLSAKFWDIIRYHSLYPWHTGNAYRELMSEKDSEILESVLDFNQFDLYSKEDTDFILTDEIKEYYGKLIDKYFPEELQW